MVSDSADSEAAAVDAEVAVDDVEAAVEDEDARDGFGRDKIFAESDLMAAARVFAERRVEVLVIESGAAALAVEAAAGCSLVKAKFGRRNTSLGFGGGVASWGEGAREEVASLEGVGAREYGCGGGIISYGRADDWGRECAGAREGLSTDARESL